MEGVQSARVRATWSCLRASARTSKTTSTTTIPRLLHLISQPASLQLSTKNATRSHNFLKMPPRDNTYHYQHADSLQERAAVELESMRSSAGTSSALHPMPPACARLLRTLPGNDECVDCGARHPEWATVSYGALICLECSGRHRRLGVQVRALKALGLVKHVCVMF